MCAPVTGNGQFLRRHHPKPILMQIGMAVSDELDLSLDEGRIVLVPAKRQPRAG